jgi:hypothetical protein
VTCPPTAEQKGPYEDLYSPRPRVYVPVMTVHEEHVDPIDENTR